MNKILLAIIIFLLGFTIRDISDIFIPSAKAEVAGMDSYALKSDYDFKRAVKAIVEDCEIQDGKISC